MLNAATTPANEILDRPLALPWVPGAQRLELISLPYMRRSSSRTDGYEVECRFAQLDDQGQWLSEYRGGWAPIEQLALLRIGSIFEDRSLIGYRDGRSIKQATRFHPKFRSELQEFYRDLYKTSGEEKPNSHVISRLFAPSVCVGEFDRRKIYIPSSEILRFYFGPNSLIAGNFMNAVHGQPGLGLFDADETRFLENGVFQIAPIAGLTDRASALHLALLLNSPDLLQMWQYASDQSLASAHSKDGAFQCNLMLPNEQYSLSLSGKNSMVEGPLGTDPKRAFVVSSILSDYRAPPFEKLIIKIPYGLDDVDLDDIDGSRGSGKTQFLNVVTDDAKLDPRRRPGALLARTSPHHESLRRTFPNLSRIPIHYDVETAARRQPREVERQVRMIEALSTLAPGGDGKVGGVQFRPSRSYAPSPPLEAPTRRLFSGASGVVGQFEAVATASLQYPVSVFVRAMDRLARHHAGGLVAQDPLSLAKGSVMLMTADPSWAATAKGRRIAIGWIEVDDQVVYAFEMSRRRKSESISLGLVAKADGSRMSIAELSRVVEHATQQIGSRGSKTEGRDRGVWPSPTAFLDITGRVVTHTAKRRLASVLAEELEALSRSLCWPAEAAQAAS